MMEVPIETLHLFPELDTRLIKLLKSLSAEEWNKPTLARLWTVKDIVAHLLDGNMRHISMAGHNYFGEKPANINSYTELVNYLNGLNADWVKAMKRVSPSLLISMLEITGPQYHACLQALKPFDRAMFSVAWAGEKHSQNWFHIAREYTEKWHHQQQIHEAVGRPGNMEPEFFTPLIQTFMQAVPHTYRNVIAEENTTVHIHIGQLRWYLARQIDEWKLTVEAANTPSAIVEIEPGIAWKLFTKGISKEEAAKQINIKGDRMLADPLLSMVSVMA